MFVRSRFPMAFSQMNDRLLEMERKLEQEGFVDSGMLSNCLLDTLRKFGFILFKFRVSSHFFHTTKQFPIFCCYPGNPAASPRSSRSFALYVLLSLSERMNRLFVDSICDLPPSRMNLVPLQNTNGLPLLVFFYFSFCCAVHNSENFHVNRCVFPFPSPPSWFKEVALEITFFTKILRALWITETWYIYTHIFSTFRFKGAKTDGYSVYYFSE